MVIRDAVIRTARLASVRRCRLVLSAKPAPGAAAPRATQRRLRLTVLVFRGLTLVLGY